eukprot:CAMPEP_0178713816 /NCGR_PEP_ID=MMETSP0699-20121125/19656_1 /TAXON_ID=265572 /ORGANISM="Extubocellulus spinifer, Strain CCMP396" /LENGTH=48 /DNA_ID= /DNA_START= /DNA_END= /DNA_ORIENTATION=
MAPFWSGGSRCTMQAMLAAMASVCILHPQSTQDRRCKPRSKSQGDDAV